MGWSGMANTGTWSIPQPLILGIEWNEWCDECVFEVEVEKW